MKPGNQTAGISPTSASESATRSRRILLIVASVIFAIWVAMMIVMYFGTVYPHRYPATSPMPSLTR